MTTFATLKNALAQNPDCSLEFTLNGEVVLAPHFHITEVGHVTKDFIDCGGARHTTSSCVLQTLVAHDTDHRLRSERLAEILNLTGRILPHDDLPVEVEIDRGTTALYALGSIDVEQRTIRLVLAPKHTACLAPEKCGLDQVPVLPSAPNATACDPSGSC